MLGAMLGCFPERLYAKNAEAVFVPESRHWDKSQRHISPNTPPDIFPAFSCCYRIVLREVTSHTFLNFRTFKPIKPFEVRASLERSTLKICTLTLGKIFNKNVDKDFAPVRY